MLDPGAPESWITLESVRTKGLEPFIEYHKRSSRLFDAYTTFLKPRFPTWMPKQQNALTTLLFKRTFKPKFVEGVNGFVSVVGFLRVKVRFEDEKEWRDGYTIVQVLRCTNYDWDWALGHSSEHLNPPTIRKAAQGRRTSSATRPTRNEPGEPGSMTSNTSLRGEGPLHVQHQNLNMG